MTDPLPKEDREPEDVLCRRRFLTRSRASSKATEDIRLVEDVDGVSEAVGGDGAGVVDRESRALKKRRLVVAMASGMVLVKRVWE